LLLSAYGKPAGSGIPRIINIWRNEKLIDSVIKNNLTLILHLLPYPLKKQEIELSIMKTKNPQKSRKSGKDPRLLKRQ